MWGAHGGRGAHGAGDAATADGTRAAGNRGRGAAGNLAFDEGEGHVFYG
jgi:hypothetical protein